MGAGECTSCMLVFNGIIVACTLYTLHPLLSADSASHMCTDLEDFWSCCLVCCRRESVWQPVRWWCDYWWLHHRPKIAKKKSTFGRRKYPTAHHLNWKENCFAIRHKPCQGMKVAGTDLRETTVMTSHHWLYAEAENKKYHQTFSQNPNLEFQHCFANMSTDCNSFTYLMNFLTHKKA